MGQKIKTKTDLQNQINLLQKQIGQLQKQLSKNSKKTLQNSDKNHSRPFNKKLENYKDIISSLSQGIILLDASGRLIYFNNSAQNILGLSDKHLSKPIFSNPDWKTIRRNGSAFSSAKHPALETLKKGTKHQNVIMGIQKKDNRPVWISVDSIPLSQADGEGTYAVVISFNDVSELIATGQELSKSEERHKIISAISSDYIYAVKKEDLSLEWVSGAFKKITGYTPDEINKLPDKWISVIHPDDARVIGNKVIKDVPEKKVSSYDLRIIRKDGKIRWINDKITAIHDNSGNPVRLYGAVKDITGQKKAEETLLESEKQLSVIFDNSSDLQMLFAVGVDSNFRVVNVNKTCIDQLKKINKSTDEGSFLGKNMYDVFTRIFKVGTDKYDLLLGHFFRTIAIAKQHEYQFNYSYRNQEFHSEVVLTPIYSKENVCIYIHWSSRDVTFRNKTLSALKESEAKYRELIEKSGDAIFLLYKDHFELTNSRFLDLFGYSQKEISSTYFNLMDLISPKSKKYIFEQYQKRQKGEKSDSKFQFYGITKNRKEIILEAAVGEINYKNGKAIQGILRDITERTRMEEELRQSQKMDAIGRLAGGIAHDFNNLLTIINGYCELLLIKSNTPQIQKPLQGILEASSRATSLTSQLLAFSRKQMIKPVVLSLNELLYKQIKLLKRLIGENIDIRMNLNNKLHNIKADPGQIEQIIMNIAINARDAMPGGGKLTIRTNNVIFDKNDILELPGAKTGSYVELSIKDSGIGMDEDTLSRVFEPFFSTKDRDKGTGLGLATVYGIIKQNNGFIYADSKPKFGTRFRVYLPAVRKKIDLKQSLSQEEDLKGYETILLVEDDFSVREVTRSTLTGYGYNVIVAADGKEAQKLFRKHNNRIKLLLTDVVMPVMSGKELADRLLKINPRLKVIFFSGYTDNTLLTDPGNNNLEYLQKPYTHYQLAKRIKNALSNRKHF